MRIFCFPFSLQSRGTRWVYCRRRGAPCWSAALMIWTQSVGEFLVSFWWLPASLLTLGAWTTTLLLWCLYSSQFRVKWGCLFSKSPYFCLSSYPQGTGRTVLPHCVWTSCLHKSPQRPPSVWLAQPLARRLQDPSFVTQWPSLSSRLPSVLICA